MLFNVLLLGEVGPLDLPPGTAIDPLFLVRTGG